MGVNRDVVHHSCPDRVGLRVLHEAYRTANRTISMGGFEPASFTPTRAPSRVAASDCSLRVQAHHPNVDSVTVRLLFTRSLPPPPVVQLTLFWKKALLRFA
jgi:hypothetical protein